MQLAFELADIGPMECGPVRQLLLAHFAQLPQSPDILGDDLSQWAFTRSLHTRKTPS